MRLGTYYLLWYHCDSYFVVRVSVRSLRLLWKRVTCDVHILDLTDPNQVSVDVLPSRDQVKVTYKV